MNNYLAKLLEKDLREHRVFLQQLKDATTDTVLPVKLTRADCETIKQAPRHIEELLAMAQSLAEDAIARNGK